MTRRGYTLIEILLVMTLLSVLVAVAAPLFGRWQSRLAVTAARDELASALALTRMTAVGAGGAELVIDSARGSAWAVTAARDTVYRLTLADQYGVRVATGSEAPVAIRFDGLGIGRMANRRVSLTRGRETAGLTISAYGRARRW